MALARQVSDAPIWWSRAVMACRIVSIEGGGSLRCRRLALRISKLPRRSIIGLIDLALLRRLTKACNE